MQEFPPASKLDPRVYGDHTSTIRATHIENSLDGLTVHEVLLIKINLLLEAKLILKYVVFSLYVNNQACIFMLQAIQTMRLFILDHHDALMPYISRINSTNTKTYATRTLLFLQDDGTLKPLAIELSLPHPQGEQHGAVSKVLTAAQEGVAASVWQLAKAYAAVNDSGYHQLVSHWYYIQKSNINCNKVLQLDYISELR